MVFFAAARLVNQFKSRTHSRLLMLFSRFLGCFWVAFQGLFVGLLVGSKGDTDSLGFHRSRCEADSSSPAGKEHPKLEP